jgi:hypothetical protein
MRRVLSALTLLALWPATALAASVFLNGVPIDGLTNQTFDKVTSVRLDEQGNVHIQAPAYAVKRAPSAAAPVPTSPAPAAPPAAPPPAPVAAPAAAPVPAAEVTGPARLTRRYWLVTEQTARGMSGYDIDLFINSTWVRTLRNGEEQVILELTRYLVPGRNTLRLMAHKVAAGARRSEAGPQHVFGVIVGEGNEGGGRVMIDSPLLRFQRTGAQTEDVSEEFPLITR